MSSSRRRGHEAEHEIVQKLLFGSAVLFLVVKRGEDDGSFLEFELYHQGRRCRGILSFDVVGTREKRLDTWAAKGRGFPFAKVELEFDLFGAKSFRRSGSTTSATTNCLPAP